jgi:hypothetical protein
MWGQCENRSKYEGIRCKYGKNIIINKKKSLEIPRVMAGQGEEERGENKLSGNFVNSSFESKKKYEIK